MSRKMSERTSTKVIPFLGYNAEMAMLEGPQDNGEMSKFGRFLCFIGVGMPNPEKPNVWNWNPAVITLLLVIGGGIYYYGHQNGVYETEIKNLNEKYSEAKAVADGAKNQADSAILALGGQTPTPKSKEKK